MEIERANRVTGKSQGSKPKKKCPDISDLFFGFPEKSKKISKLGNFFFEKNLQ